MRVLRVTLEEGNKITFSAEPDVVNLWRVIPLLSYHSGLRFDHGLRGYDILSHNVTTPKCQIVTLGNSTHRLGN